MILKLYDYNYSANSIPDETHIWYLEPTHVGKILLGIVVPVITAIGALFNIINAIIYTKPRMAASTYSYLLGMLIINMSGLKNWN